MARHAARKKSAPARLLAWAILAAAVAVACLAYAVVARGVLRADTDSASTASPAQTASSAASASPANGSLVRQAVPSPRASASSAANGSTAASAADQAALDALKQRLQSQIAGYSGTYGVAVIDLSAPGQPGFELNNQQLPAASLIKLAVLNAVYAHEADGSLRPSNAVDSLLKQMITVSSNEATNSLVSLLGNGNFAAGEAAVNAASASSRLTGFALDRKLGITGYSGANDNYAEPAGCAKELQMIYNGTLVSKEASQQMMNLLLAQTRRSKIPAGVPAGVPVGNKTGENTGIEHDAAVVYGSKTGGHDYVLVVMTKSASNAVANIGAISSTVYQALGKAH